LGFSSSYGGDSRKVNNKLLDQMRKQGERIAKIEGTLENK
jgi:hypothetical protein